MGRVVIFGAGSVGKTLLEILEARKHKVSIIDENIDAINEIATEKSATAIHGDVTDPSLLDELDLGKMDYVFAVTGSEEANFLSSVYSKQAGAKHVICWVKSLKHSKLLDKMNIQSVVSELILASELANRASSPIIHKMLNPVESNLEVIEKDADKHMIGKSVGHLQEKKNFIIISIFDEEENKFRVAKSSERIKKDSRLILLRKKGFKLF